MCSDLFALAHSTLSPNFSPLASTSYSFLPRFGEQKVQVLCNWALLHVLSSSNTFFILTHTRMRPRRILLSQKDRSKLNTRLHKYHLKYTPPCVTPSQWFRLRPVPIPALPVFPCQQPFFKPSYHLLNCAKRSLLSFLCIFLLAFQGPRSFLLFFFSRTSFHSKRLLIWLSAQPNGEITLFLLFFFFGHHCFPFVANPCSLSYSSLRSGQMKVTRERERERDKWKEGSGTLSTIWPDRKVKPKKKGDVSAFFWRIFICLLMHMSISPILQTWRNVPFSSPPIT